MSAIPGYRAEISRKVLHLIAAVTPLVYVFVSHDTMVRLLAPCVLIAVTVELLRYASPGFQALFRRCVGFMVRDVEWNRITGATYVLVGALLTVWWFPKPVAIARPQRWDSKRLGIADAPVHKRSLGRLDRSRRRRRRRLPYLHMDDVDALRLSLRCRSHDVHHNERRHIATFGWLQKLFCRLKHRFRPVGPHRPAPLLPYSADCLRLVLS